MATDTFSADVSPLASPWASVGSLNQLKALSGVVTTVTDGTDSAMRYSTSTATLSRVTITAIGNANGGPGMFDTLGNGYAVVMLFDFLFLYLWTAGVPSEFQIAAEGYVAVATDSLEIDTTHATNVIVKVNGTPLITHADATFRTGLKPAIFIHDTATFTDWTDGAGGGGGSGIPVKLANARRRRTA